jgi:hypothetical protein
MLGAMECPGCGEAMAEGALAMNGRRLLFANTVWEPTKPSFRGAKKVLVPGPLGLHTRVAWRCPACETILIPPAEREERLIPYTGRRLLRSDLDAEPQPQGASPPPDPPMDPAPDPATWESFERDDEDPLRE